MCLQGSARSSKMGHVQARLRVPGIRHGVLARPDWGRDDLSLRRPADNRLRADFGPRYLVRPSVTSLYVSNNRNTDRVDLSIPLIYISCSGQGGRGWGRLEPRTRSRRSGWSCHWSPGAGAGTSGCQGLAMAAERSSGRRCVRSARVQGGTSPSGPLPTDRPVWRWLRSRHARIGLTEGSGRGGGSRTLTGTAPTGFQGQASTDFATPHVGSRSKLAPRPQLIRRNGSRSRRFTSEFNIPYTICGLSFFSSATVARTRVVRIPWDS